MAKLQRFYLDDQQWHAFAQQLKLTPCPHCHAVGALIRHGNLCGFDDSNPTQKTLRARRIFCSNRNARPGCGHTFSLWCADKIRRLSLTADALWRFLQHVVTLDCLAAAIRAVADCRRSDRTWQRLWQRFQLGQSNLRTALSALCPPPHLPAEPRPAAHVVAHLHAAFPEAPCPITAFQLTLHTFFF
jgi:hypothetical protein